MPVLGTQRNVLQDKLRLLCGKLKSTGVSEEADEDLQSQCLDEIVQSQWYALGLQELENFWRQEEPVDGPYLQTCNRVRFGVRLLTLKSKKVIEFKKGQKFKLGAGRREAPGLDWCSL